MASRSGVDFLGGLCEVLGPQGKQPAASSVARCQTYVTFQGIVTKKPETCGVL